VVVREFFRLLIGYIYWCSALSL